MTQYAAGPIFRFVDSGCMTEEELAKEDRAKVLNVQKQKATRWKEDGLGLITYCC